MAYYAALVSVVQLLEEITDHDPYPDSVLDKQQVGSLFEKFNLLLESLEDYSPKPHKQETTEILERRIRDAANRAQDIIESHIHPKMKTRGLIARFSGLLVSAFRKAPRELIKKVEAEVDSIVEELMRIKVITYRREDLQLNFYISADTVGGASTGEASSVRENSMVGIEEHLMTIKDQLCGQSSRREVISIVGMGGLGKTTLARNIFYDEYIVYYFHCRAWVTVSQDYNLRKVFLDIASSLNIMNEVSSRAEKEVIGEHIYKYLIGRKYLIIIDDIWDTKVWDDIRRILPDNLDGSRIVITTRLSDVALYADNSSGFHHQMQFLNEDHSWTLLREKVFAQQHCPKELEVIGKCIARNCKGLPLAIVVVAGILSNVNKAQQDWEEIAIKVSFVTVDQNDEHFSKILSLSYYHLPHHLKPCFLYLGGFPEDYDISIPMLIKLWVAEGFLKPIASKSLEEVGEEYFENLVNRNLILITKKTPWGKFKLCSIHDILRDLCIQKARHENFFHCLHKKGDFHRKLMGDVRRFYIQMWKGSLFSKYKNEHVSHVRAVLFLDNDSIWHPFLSVVSGFKLLRVLDSRSIMISIFPTVILELLHLRYLALGAYSSKICIPPSIFELQNLQTLVVNGDTSLPSEIWTMPQLRHLIFGDVTLAPPVAISSDGVPLGRLQTLGKVTDFKFTNDVIEMIPSLKKLKVRYFHEARRSWEEFGLNNLVHLHQLETLHIWFCLSSMVASPLPVNFAFPSNLIQLTLYGTDLSWTNMGVLGSLPNLQVLKLKMGSFLGPEWEPVDGEFLSLKYLLLDSLFGLRYWRAESTHFPCLERLHVMRCPGLKEIPPAIGDIPTLQCIELYAGSSLVSSALKIQEEQRDLGNYELQVRIL